MSKVRLFTPLKLRGVETKNRIIVSPMCQYSADDGMANDWHFVHLGRFALGGAGIVMVEATAVTKDGRITHGDMGLWSDAHIAPLARIATFLRNHGAVPAIQLAHAGRKASMQRPWFGNGRLMPTIVLRGETPWDSSRRARFRWTRAGSRRTPRRQDELAGLRDAYRAAIQRASKPASTFSKHICAHGYLMHNSCRRFPTSATTNMVASAPAACAFRSRSSETVRAAWPAEKPLFVRISSVDGVDGGWTIEDSVAFARELKGARRRCDRLLVGWAHRLGDGGAHSARLRLPAAVRRAHP